MVIGGHLSNQISVKTHFVVWDHGESRAGSGRTQYQRHIATEHSWRGWQCICLFEPFSWMLICKGISISRHTLWNAYSINMNTSDDESTRSFISVLWATKHQIPRKPWSCPQHRAFHLSVALQIHPQIHFHALKHLRVRWKYYCNGLQRGTE